MEYSLAEKERFFAHLDSLDESEDEIDNSTQRLEKLAQKRRRLNPRPNKSTLKKAETLPSKHTNTEQDRAPTPLLRATTDIPTNAAPSPRPTISIPDDETESKPFVEPFRRRSSKSRGKDNARLKSDVESVQPSANNESAKPLFAGLSFCMIFYIHSLAQLTVRSLHTQ